jgi:ornithine carbamoyltransferase
MSTLQTLTNERKAPAPAKPNGDLLTLASLGREQVTALLGSARSLKRDVSPFRHSLAGKTVILLFEQPSLRTRLTFEIGVQKLGGIAVYVDHSASRIGQRESVYDTGKNLERMVDCIVARVFHHNTLEELAAATRVPVINGLSDRFHPCQALADAMTIFEHVQPRSQGPHTGVRVAYVGDGNNVAHSLMHAAAILGFDLTVITPEPFRPAPEVLAEAHKLGEPAGVKIVLSADPGAVAGADVVYTDVWVSMAQQEQLERRRKRFQPYQVNRDLFAKASPNAKFMHCLPAHRGMEVTDEIIDSPASVVYDQAENRMHVQNALLLHLLAGQRAG